MGCECLVHVTVSRFLWTNGMSFGCLLVSHIRKVTRSCRLSIFNAEAGIGFTLLIIHSLTWSFIRAVKGLATTTTWDMDCRCIMAKTSGRQQKKQSDIQLPVDVFALDKIFDHEEGQCLVAHNYVGLSPTEPCNEIFFNISCFWGLSLLSGVVGTQCSMWLLTCIWILIHELVCYLGYCMLHCCTVVILIQSKQTPVWIACSVPNYVASCKLHPHLTIPGNIVGR